MEQVINKRVCELSKVEEIIQTILIIMGALLVPIVIPEILKVVFGANSSIVSNSQIIVGSIVNTALIISALNVRGWRNILLIATLPSISAVTGGYIFGTLSKVTVVMIPGIWLGNLAIILTIKWLYLNRKVNYVITSLVAITIKVFFIYGVLNIWMLVKVLPTAGAVAQTLKNTMGVTQLITASIGAIASYVIINLKSEK